MGEREADLVNKVRLGRAVREMMAGDTYKEVWKFIQERCGAGKWWTSWLEQPDDKAAALRKEAQGYLAFDRLLHMLVNMGDGAQKILEGETQDSNK